MAGITGQGTTFNLPNYVGELFELTPSDTPFLSMIGGLTGGRETDQKKFEWQAYDLRAPENPSHLEGQDAPSGRERVRQNIENIVQIFHSTVEVSYTKQAATGQRDGLPGPNPVNDEMDWQVEQELKSLARDVENVFLTGAFAEPADNTTARKTQGVLGAITTNVVDVGGTVTTPVALTEDHVLDAMQAAWSSGGITEQETATLMCGAARKRDLSTIFITNKNYQEESRRVAGVDLQTIETDFGRVNVMLNRYMPADQIAIVSAEVCAPRFLRIPDKGHFFEEMLAQTGASYRSQIYGEIGLEYGAEIQHAKIDNIDDGVA